MTTTETRNDLYLEVLQYYAKQMRLLDDRHLAAYAETFTTDAVFSHSPDREPARTREGILRELEEVHRQFDADPMKRRHHFTMVEAEPQEDGSISSTVYALVVIVRPGDKPELRASCVVHDVLVREDGELRNQSRRVEID